MVDLNIDVSGIDPSEKREYPQLPRGWYSAYIDESEMKDTKAKQEGRNANQYLQLRFVIMDWMDKGQMPDMKFIGRKFYTRLNIINTSKEAVEIAYRDLSAIGHAVGVTSITTSDLLHDKPLEIFLEETLDYKDRPSNEVLYYRACNSGDTTSELHQVAQTQANTAVAQTGSKTPIWDN